MDLPTYRAQFNRDARQRLRALILRTQRLSSNRVSHLALGQVETLFFGGGKRVRPYLAALAYKTSGGQEAEQCKCLSFALELFHLSCLIHDDIMDGADTRHGVPTIHALLKDTVDEQQAGSQAILVGDLLLHWAHQLISQLPGSSRIHPIFVTTCEEVTVGQMLDVDAAGNDRLSWKELHEKTRLKTSRYTFVGPIRLGGALAGSDLTRFAESYGTAMGMAFQIQDDLFDLIARPEELQKPGLTDLAERQQTFVTHYLQRRARPRYYRAWQAALGKRPLVQAELAEILEVSGTTAACGQEIARYLEEARRALRYLPETDRPIWGALITQMGERRS